MTGSSLVTYTYFGPSFAHGGAQPSINIGVIHDIEADPKRARLARGLCGPDYFGHGGDPGKPVSIHYVVGFDDICQGTDEDTIAYHVGNGNSGTIGIEQMGFASYARVDWLSNDLQLHNLASLMQDISARRPLIRLRWLTDAELVYAWNHKTTPGGWTTHAQMSRVELGSDHTDPGSNWPADYVMSLAQNNTVKDWFDMATLDDLRAVIRDEVASQLAQAKADIYNGTVSILRAPEFVLDQNRRNQDVFNNIVAVLHAPEFAGWQQKTMNAADVILNPKAGTNNP